MDYKEAGVNIEKAEGLVSWLKSSVFKEKQLPGSDFCSYLAFPAANYKKPVLVSSADGVGTKTILASFYKEWRGIGRDLAAMCLNDLLCSGAKPLFFLDYYSAACLEREPFQEFLQGLNAACQEVSCPLLGGETAELPGLFVRETRVGPVLRPARPSPVLRPARPSPVLRPARPGPDASSHFDCAGFVVGAAEEADILGPRRVRAGDKIFGLKSSGFHSNGYSLLRQIYHSPKDLEEKRQILMEPTRLYAVLHSRLSKMKNLKAIAHITGGGLNNLSRIIPEGLIASLEPWEVPEIFLEVKQKARLSWKSLLTTFNCGLGLALVFEGEPEASFCKEEGDQLIEWGRVEKGDPTEGERWRLNKDFS